jgi:hypothetical protein
MLFRSTCAAVAAILLALPVVAGCIDENAGMVPVKGKVTYRGKPVPNGTINFMPDEMRSAYAEIQPDGSYSLMAFPGTHKVVVMALEDMSDRLPEDRNPLPAPIVPTKYTHVTTTDLKAEVEDKENVIDFELKDDP